MVACDPACSVTSRRTCERRCARASRWNRSYGTRSASSLNVISWSRAVPQGRADCARSRRSAGDTSAYPSSVVPLIQDVFHQLVAFDTGGTYVYLPAGWTATSIEELLNMVNRITVV